MNDSLEKSDQSVVAMPVLQEGDSDLGESRIAPCENDEKRDDRKRKSKEKSISKLAPDTPESQHNGNIDSSDDELMSDSSSEESDENENSRSPVATPVTAQENVSNCEAGTQENVSDCETAAPQKSTNSREVTEKSVSNCGKSATQESIKSCATAQESSISNRDISQSVKLEEDKPALENDLSEPQILLTRVDTLVSESEPIRRSSRWGDRLRVRPPPVPKEETLIIKNEKKKIVIEIPKKDRPAPRTVAQKKVNYCELSSSEDDEPSSRKKGRNQQSHGRMGRASDEEFSMSEESDFSDNSTSRKKKNSHTSRGKDSSDDDKSEYSARKKGDVGQKRTKEKHLSEYEQQRRKNIEEKMAFLQTLKFEEIKEDIKNSKKRRKKNVELQDENLPTS